MSGPSQPDPAEELGPIDFLAIEFPGEHISAPGFEQLLSLADQRVIDLLDLEFIAKDSAGGASKVDVDKLAKPDGVDLSAWAGSSSGLLDRTDVDEIAAAIQPGSVAAVIVYENRWAAEFVAAARRNGGVLIASQRVGVQAVLDALDAAEAAA